MSPAPPDRLTIALSGRYRIERELGQGGMATVYLADDLKHERRVALKVLKPELAAVVGAERFLAEIRTTANLQHPHILPLFDSGDADRVLWYAMPYVEGESLRERIDREKQLPVDEAVAIATKVLGALEAAHARGIIHRDIKPANILLDAQGEPLIADFGIALAVQEAGGGRLTETGLSVGTPYYMSPEQATGDRDPDARADIYSLGCVLYEMLTGEPPFPGSTAQAVLGRIITGEPTRPTDVRKSVPSNVDAAVITALEKLPADRFGSASEFARAVADPSFRRGPSDTAVAGAEASSWKRVALGAFALAVVVVVWAVGGAVSSGGTVAAPVLRYSIPVDPSGVARLGHPEGTPFGRPFLKAFDISPDGRMLAYAAWSRDEATGELESHLYLRRLDQPRPTRVAEGVDAGRPVFSPDGDWIAAGAGGSLIRISVRTGDIETLLREPPEGANDFDWADSGEIFLTSATGDVWRIPESGGEPRRIEVRPAPADTSLTLRPRSLPGGRIVLFSVLDFGDDQYLGEIRAVDVETGESWVVAEDAMDPGYLESGHLLFMRDGTLMAAPMDLETARLTGAPVTIVDDVMHALYMPNTARDSGVGLYATSRAGDLAYLPGGVFPVRPRALVRVAPDGRVDTLPVPPRQYSRVRVSPDGSRLAVTGDDDARERDIQILDLQRGVMTRLSVDSPKLGTVTWSPDGEFLAFTATDEYRPFRMRADGGAPAEILPFELSRSARVDAWHPNGDLIFSDEGGYYRGTPSGELEPYFESDYFLAYGALSPDGRWFAYASVESGDYAVYVRPYPGPGAATRVSPGYGVAPAWHPDGRTLYYRSDDDGDVIYSVSVSPGESLDLGTPRFLFPDWPWNATIPARAYDVAPDGSFFVPTGEENLRDAYAVDDIHLFLGFSQEVARRLAGSQGGE